MGIMDAVDTFFRTQGFMPHGMCLLWRPTILWMMFIANIGIALAYFIIPFELLYLIIKRRDIGFKWIFVLFGMFIFACGCTHVMSAITLWTPLYGLEALILFITAVVSLLTAALLWPLLPTLLKIPSPWTLEETNKALTNSNATLKELEEQLRAKNIELKNANLAKNRFLASMSHELRTPMNAIIGFTGTLLMKLPGPLNTEQENQLSMVDGSAKHLLALINDILDLAKIDSGEIKIFLEEVSVNKVIKEVAAALTVLIGNKPVDLRIDLPDEEIYIQTDKRMLTQILINLSSNAVKFTEKGFIELDMKLVTQEGKGFIMISVTDSGIGIKEIDKEKLFQAFKRIETTERITDGTGLGLYLSKRLAMMIQGSIQVESIYGKGSRFTLLIPQG